MAKYEDSDWAELPADAKAAAEKLGYNKKMWDSDKGERSRNLIKMQPVVGCCQSFGIVLANYSLIHPPPPPTHPQPQSRHAATSKLEVAICSCRFIAIVVSHLHLLDTPPIFSSSINNTDTGMTSMRISVLPRVFWDTLRIPGTKRVRRVALYYNSFGAFVFIFSGLHLMFDACHSFYLGYDTTDFDSLRRFG